MKIAVLGDLHHVRAEGYVERQRRGIASIYEIADMERSLRLQRDEIPAVCREIAAQRVDFCVCTGDVIHGYGDTPRDNCEEMREAFAMLEALGAPLLCTLGTHDGMAGDAHAAAVREVWLPHTQRALAELERRFGVRSVNPQEGCYALQIEDSALLLLDYTLCREGDAQERLVRETLQDPSLEHVLLFAHAPLEPVFRLAFSRAEYVRSILPLVQAHPIDALFCAHTHNQVASLHTAAYGRYAQLQSTPLADRAREPIDLQAELPRLCECELGWSYQEDTMPSWWLLTLDGRDCYAEWYALGRGCMGRVSLRRGAPTFAQTPAPMPREARWRGEPPLRARLLYSGSQVDGALRWTLNGEALPSPGESSYFLRRSVDVPPEWVRAENRLCIRLPAHACCIGGFVLEIETQAGRFRTQPEGYVTNHDELDEWDYGEPMLTRCSPDEAFEASLAFAR